MTDEEYGRAWAAENGVRPPNSLSKTRWIWHDTDENGRLDLELPVLVLPHPQNRP